MLRNTLLTTGGSFRVPGVAAEQQHRGGAISLWLFSCELHGDTCQCALRGLDLSKVSLLY